MPGPTDEQIFDYAARRAANPQEHEPRGMIPETETKAQYQLADITSPVSEGGSQRPPLAPQPAGVEGTEVPRVTPKHPDQVRMFDIASNQIVNVPGHEATDAFTSGRYHLIEGEQVHVQLPDGRLGRMDPEHISDAVNHGAVIVPESTVWERHLARSAAEHPGRAFVSGVARGFLPSIPGTPLGADKLVQDIGDLTGGDAEDIAAQQRADIEAHPYVSAGGELAGLAGGAAFGNEGNLVNAAGELGEHAAARAVGTGATSVLGRVAQRAVPLAVRGGLEGALLGAQETTSEEALGDPDINGEKVLAAMGHGALLGAGGGALFGTAGALLGEARAGMAGLLERAPKRLPEASNAGVEATVRGATGAEPAPGIVRRFRNMVSDARELQNIDEVRDAASREVRASVDDMLKASREVTEEAQGQIKRSHLRTSVQPADEGASLVAANQHYASMRAELQDMMMRPDEYGNPQTFKKLNKVLESKERELAAATKAGDVSEAYGVLDDAKRAVGRDTRNISRAARSPSSSAFDLANNRAAADRMQALYERMRTTLEDETLWGRAGADQKSINAAWTRQIEAQQRFERALTTDIGRDPKNPWQNVRGVDPAKADSYVRNLTNPNNDLTHQAIRDYVASTKDLAQAIGSSYELPPEKVAQVARASEAATRFGNTITKAEGSLTRANQMKALLEAEERGPGHHLATAALGVMSGHPLAGAAAVAAGVITRPAHAAMQVARVASLIEKSNGAIARGVRGLFTRTAETAEEKPGLLRKVAASTRTARTVEKDKVSREAQAARLIAAVGAAQANPDRHAQVISHHLGPLAEVAPTIAGRASAVAARATAYLAGQAPKSSPDLLLGGAHAPPPSKSEAEAFLRKAHAVDDPASVLEHMHRGTVTRDEVDAIKAVYPRMYEEMRRQVSDHMADEIASGHPPSYQARLQIASLFDMPTDATLTPPYLRALQATFAPGGAAPGGGAPKPGGTQASKGVPGKPLRGQKDLSTPTEELER